MKKKKTDYSIYHNFLLIFFLLNGCSAHDSNCSIEEIFKDGSAKMEVCILDISRQVVEIKEFYQDGAIMSKFLVIKNQVSGEFLKYFNSGALKEKKYYVNGKINGDSYTYDEGGKVINYNFFFYGHSIYVKTLDGLVDTTPIFIPIVSYDKEERWKQGNTFNFKVSLPLPDSLLPENELFLAYQMKPLSLADSIIISPKYEVPIGRKIWDKSCELILEEEGEQIFYWHVFDKKDNHIFSPTEDTIYVSPASYF